MSVLLGFAVFFFVLYFWPKRKEKPIDFAKDSAYYMREYKHLLEHQTEPEPPKEEKPNITINITHNHLHIHTKDEENLHH